MAILNEASGGKQRNKDLGIYDNTWRLVEGFRLCFDLGQSLPAAYANAGIAHVSGTKISIMVGTASGYIDSHLIRYISVHIPTAIDLNPSISISIYLAGTMRPRITAECPKHPLRLTLPYERH